MNEEKYLPEYNKYRKALAMYGLVSIVISTGLVIFTLIVLNNIANAGLLCN